LDDIIGRIEPVGERSERTSGTAATVAHDAGQYADLTDLVVRMDDVTVRRGDTNPAAGRGLVGRAG